ncbi:MAG: hypothetical protein ACR2O0_15840 [Rhizobiaceae bacterium]
MAVKSQKKKNELVKSRLVLNFPGFEQTSAESQLDRIKHSAGKTGEIWNFGHERLSVHQESGVNHAIGDCRTKSADWQVNTRIVQFSWNDIIQAYEKVAHPLGIIRNFPKFLAFFTDGTVSRYRKASGRYWAFTIFPILLLAIFIGVSWYASTWFTSFLNLSGSAATIIEILVTIVLTLLFCKWPGDKAYLILTINDWGFARDMVNRTNPDIEERYQEFADTIVKEIKTGSHDEIVFSGHSFGSVWAVAGLALALEKEPDLLKGRKAIFMALGSSLLKIALAKNADFMREWTKKVTSQPELFWHEIQTKDDIIAFYKCDPFEVLGFPEPAGGYRIDRVNYKKAMDKKRYKSMRRSFYRTHRQYILYQDKPATFDYMLRLFGPVYSRNLAELPESVQTIDPGAKLV